MVTCKSIWAVTRINFQRWKSDRRIWIIFIFIGALMVQELKGFTLYGLESGEKCTAYLLPLLFAEPNISIGSMKIMLYLGCLFMLCDAPFMYSMTPYIVLRSRREKWWIGECFYIFLTTLMYALFILLVSTIVILPVATFGDSWGGVARNITYGTNEFASEQLAEMYHIYLDFPLNTLSYLLPAGTQMYTFLSVWASFFVLGLVQYLVNLVSKSNFLGFICAAVFVFLDPVLKFLSSANAFRWVMGLSPVCWVSSDNLKMVNQYNFLTIPYIVLMFAVLIVLLLFGIWRVSHRVIINTRRDE